MRQLWAGIDAGKTHHHCVVIDSDGTRLLSRRVANDEAELSALIDDARNLAADRAVTWAVDLNHGGAALLIALMAEQNQHLLYIPGRVVHHAAGSYRAGTAKLTRKTRQSSLIRHECAGTCIRCGPATRSVSN